MQYLLAQQAGSAQTIMIVHGLLVFLLFFGVAYIVVKFLLRMHQVFTAIIETSESIKRVEKKLDELAKQNTK